MKAVPFWIDDYPGPTFPRSPELPRRLDVAVVGGGYTGLSAALALARGGASVAVFERGRIGSGASSVNGGQLCPGLKKAPAELFTRYGEDLGRRLW